MQNQHNLLDGESAILLKKAPDCSDVRTRETTIPFTYRGIDWIVMDQHAMNMKCIKLAHEQIGVGHIFAGGAAIIMLGSSRITNDIDLHVPSEQALNNYEY